MTVRKGAAALFALWALSQAAPTNGQTFKYMAFGDSITCGKYDGNNCNVPMTPVGPLDPDGYPGRLRSQLSCTGGSNSCQVYNYGKPGEDTAQGVSRIQTVLNNGNGPYDIVLLMHGTNDVYGGTSNTTIQFNLKAMDNHAASAGVDTVFASIIRFDPTGSAYTTAKKNQIAALRNNLASIASSRDSWFADPWSVLCPNQTCFDNHYTDLDGNPPPPLGLHPDESGYDILADEFEASVTQLAVPPVPTAQNPVASADVTSTTVTWSDASRTTWFQVRWNAGTGGEGSEWVAGLSSCSSGSCSYTIPGLAPGAHTWQVRGRNPHGRSNWTANESFNLFTSSPNTPDPISPITDVYGTPPAEFRWTDEGAATNGAKEYQLLVKRDGATIYNQDVVPTCSAGECAFDPGFVWSPATYAWQVRAENPAGASAWSSETSFIYTDAIPSQPVLVEPKIDTFDTTPVMIWRDVFGAEEFRVRIIDQSMVTVLDQTVSAATVCADGICTLESSVVLAIEDHTWEVQAINPLGSSAFAGPQSFTVLNCSPLNKTVTNTTVTSTVAEAACETLTAETNYVVQGPNGDLDLHAGIAVILGNGFSVESGGSLTCRLDP